MRFFYLPLPLIPGRALQRRYRRCNETLSPSASSNRSSSSTTISCTWSCSSASIKRVNSENVNLLKKRNPQQRSPKDLKHWSSVQCTGPFVPTAKVTTTLRVHMHRTATRISLLALDHSIDQFPIQLKLSQRFCSLIFQTCFDGGVAHKTPTFSRIVE